MLGQEADAGARPLGRRAARPARARARARARRAPSSILIDGRLAGAVGTEEPEDLPARRRTSDRSATARVGRTAAQCGVAMTGRSPNGLRHRMTWGIPWRLFKANTRSPLDQSTVFVGDSPGGRTRRRSPWPPMSTWRNECAVGGMGTSSVVCQSMLRRSAAHRRPGARECAGRFRRAPPARRRRADDLGGRAWRSRVRRSPCSKRSSRPAARGRSPTSR